MAIQILRDLRGLRVQVIHAPDPDGVALVEHLRRIGCNVEAQWPIPDAFGANADLVFLACDHERRDEIRRLARANNANGPTVMAVVGYENPSTLELVVELKAMAVVERPIRPFGLLTQLIIARSLWLERREMERRTRKLERKLSGLQKTQKAKAILMQSHGLDEEAAYQTIRQQAMAKRVSMEDMAAAIINADELLNFTRKGD